YSAVRDICEADRKRASEMERGAVTQGIFIPEGCGQIVVGTGDEYWVFWVRTYYSFRGKGIFKAQGVSNREACLGVREMTIKNIRADAYSAIGGATYAGGYFFSD